MKLAEELKSNMQQCGFWQQHGLERRSDRFQIDMAKMHQFCTSEKHKETK